MRQVGADASAEAPARQGWYRLVAAVGFEDEHTCCPDEVVDSERHRSGGWAGLGRARAPARRRAPVGDDGLDGGDGRRHCERDGKRPLPPHRSREPTLGANVLMLCQMWLDGSRAFSQVRGSPLDSLRLGSIYRIRILAHLSRTTPITRTRQVVGSDDAIRTECNMFIRICKAVLRR